MTFTEAAAQVLRLVGKPLHYKEITDVAIEKNLLSHVGKSPEVTMGARLAALVKKGDKENPLVRIKPGVFALREWDQATIDKGLADRTPALEIARTATLDLSAVSLSAKTDEEEEAELMRSSPDSGLEDETGTGDAPPSDEEETARRELAARASDLFEAEEDDDLPIFGRPDEEEEGEGDDEEGDGGEERAGERDAVGRRRRRRRRRGRGERDESRGDDLPAYTVSDAPAEVAIDAEQDRPRDRDRREDRERREEGGPALDELAGKPLADAIAQLLQSFDRGGGAVGASKLADLAQRRGRLAGDFQLVQGQILAAVRADNLRRQGAGQRPRFRVTGNRIALTDWSLDGELVRLERDIAASVERYREAARRVLLRRIQDLPHRAMGELVLLLLERLGMTDIQSVRRPGAPGAELHLSATWRGPSGNVVTAIVVRRDGREVGRERVTELRGALHHYGPANAGWLVTTGQVLSGAREEAAAAGAAPITLLDGLGLARACEEHDVAVLHTRISLSLPDMDLLEALRNG
jgi:restriction endonuclease Mrr